MCRSMSRSSKNVSACRVIPQSLFLPILAAQSPWRRFRRLFLVGLSSIVYCAGLTAGVLAEPTAGVVASQKAEMPQSEGEKKPELVRVPLGELPIAVQEMRDAILAGVVRGDFDELRTAIEWNELRPDFGLDANSDPIAYWKANMAGDGIEILSILGEILQGPPAKLPIGPDLENNAVYVWPYMSEKPPAQFTPGEKVELYRMVGPEQASAIIKSGKWTWYRLAIGADGTWHTFAQHD